MSEKPTMLSYIHSQQDILLQALAQYPTAIDAVLTELPDSNQLLILATGSSINAALSAKYYVENQANVQIDIQEPYNYLNYVKRPVKGQWVLGISQSGQSTATIEALNALADSNQKIAVTSIPDSEITECADYTLDILSGRERVGYVTVGFSATVLSLMLFGLRLGVKKGLISPEKEQQELAEFRTLLHGINETIDRTAAFYAANQAAFKTANRFMSIAYGPAYGTAKEMETKFSETVRVPSQGIDLEAFMHGPYLEMQPTYHLFFIDTPANAAVREKAALLKQYEENVTPFAYLVSVVKKQAAASTELVLPTVSDEEKAPLLLMVAFQLLAWEIATGKGIDLTQRIFTDFAQSVKSKTAIQDYV